MLRLPRATDKQRLGAYGNAVLRVGLAACTMLLAGGAGCSSISGLGPEKAAQSSEELGTIICGSHRTVDHHGIERQEPEYYIVSSMNRKLRHYPEFASAIDMKSVGTCDEARAFSVAYAQYFAKHPYFDKNLPWDREQARLPEIPAESATTPKIFNGTTGGPSTADPFPVVQITHQFKSTDKYVATGQPVIAADGGTFGTTCSGTFISKYFILTAAHCFQDLVLTKKTSLDPNSMWAVAAEWQIRWPDSTGHLSGSPNAAPGTMAETVVAATIVHPSYQGPSLVADAPPDARSDVAAPSFYDIGLLYLYPSQNDGFLPADAEKSTWDVQFADIEPLFSNWTLTDYGYGPTKTNGTNTDVLNSLTRSGAGLFTSGDPSASPPVKSVISSDFTGVPTDWALCHGDSGGPMVRKAAPPSTDTVIVAVNSTFEGDSLPQTCGSSSFQKNNWSRTDVAADFISGIVDLWVNSTSFNIVVPELGHPSYMKLHGRSCSANCDCGAGEFCSNPAKTPGGKFDQSISSSPTCAQCSDCGCIKGQCLPRPAAHIVPPDGGPFACPAPPP